MLWKVSSAVQQIFYLNDVIIFIIVFGIDGDGDYSHTLCSYYY